MYGGSSVGKVEAETQTAAAYPKVKACGPPILLEPMPRSASPGP
jgi:hypothetical protein